MASAVEDIVAHRAVVVVVGTVVCCHRAVAVVATARTAVVHRVRAADRSLVGVARWAGSAVRSSAEGHRATGARSVVERLMVPPQSVLGRRVIALSAQAVAGHKERAVAERVVAAALAVQVVGQWAGPARTLTQVPR